MLATQLETHFHSKYVRFFLRTYARKFRQTASQIYLLVSIHKMDIFTTFHLHVSLQVSYCILG
jgi:hypothetical protein